MASAVPPRARPPPRPPTEPAGPATVGPTAAGVHTTLPPSTTNAASTSATAAPRPPLSTRQSGRRVRPEDTEVSDPMTSTLADRVGSVLGVFGRVNVPSNMDSLIEYLSSWGGTDKALMLSQYSARLLVALTALQHHIRTWLFVDAQTYLPYGGSATARRFAALSDACADARTLFRAWSVLPIIRWMIQIEHVQPRTRLLTNVERLQGWSLLLCLPLELVAYLGAHAIVPMGRMVHRRLALYSARLWVAYLLLQCLHLMEENRLCRLQARALERTRGHPIPLPTLSRRNSGQELDDGTKRPSSPYAYYRRAEEKSKSPRLHGAAKKAAQRAALTPEMFEEYENDPKAAERAMTRALWDQLDDKKHDILVSLWLCIGYLPLVLGSATRIRRGRALGPMEPGTYPFRSLTAIFSGLVQGSLGSITSLLSFRHGWRVAAATARRRARAASASAASRYGYPVDEQMKSATMPEEPPPLLPSDFAP